MSHAHEATPSETTDPWAAVFLGAITVGICVLAPTAAYEVLYRCTKEPAIQAAIEDQSVRAVLFMYITIGTIFTASFSSFFGSIKLVLTPTQDVPLRLLATLQCLVSGGVILVVFLIGPLGHSIDLQPFTTNTKEFILYLPNHPLTYVRVTLAVLALATMWAGSRTVVAAKWREFCEWFRNPAGVDEAEESSDD